MKFVQAQFSLKYEPQVLIRRSVNEIEDFLSEHYGTPQTMPIPDDFAADAPRIILESKNGHSRIVFSQISIDFLTRFDGEYEDSLCLTKEYVLERIKLLKELLEKINIKQYFFCGITYNVYLDTDGKTPVEYIKDILGESISGIENLYEASQRIALIEDNQFFINQQVGTYKEYQGRGTVQNLLDFSSSKLVSEGVNVVLDVNNRYAYLQKGESISFENFEETVAKIYEMIEQNLQKWR